MGIGVNLKAVTGHCDYQITLVESDVGSGYILQLAAPSEITTTPDKLLMEVDATQLCMFDGQNDSSTFAAVAAASDYEADYDTVAACGSTFGNTCPGGGYGEVDFVTAYVDLCDENHDFPQEADPQGPPPTPIGPMYTWTRTGDKLPGVYGFVEYAASEGNVCGLLRFQPEGTGPVFNSVFLVEATAIGGGVVEYEYIDQRWGIPLPGGTITRTPSSSNLVLTGTTGSNALDELFGLPESATFAPSSTGDVAQVPGHILWSTAILCTGLFAAN